MRIAVVGGGVLGLTLAYRLAKKGHDVEVLEAAPRLGGLACAHDYGDFVWDRFYHCILPQDANLIGLLGELGLADDLRWTRTGTGYYSRGRFHSMSSNADFLRFPLLSILDKARLGAAIVWATRFADPMKLHDVTAKEWLTRICGKRTYEVFWRPLLEAKLGVHHERVAAVYMWATLTRLFGARSGTTNREKLGYVRGGYVRILGRLREELELRGAVIRLRTQVTSIAPANGATPQPQANGAPPACEVRFARRGARGSEEDSAIYDQVFFTAPTRLARRVVSPELLPHVEQMERAYPTSNAYLGVTCLVLALRRPLTDYYVLNIGDRDVDLTGLIEMTNLIDRREETSGRSLVYLPRYLDSEDSLLDATDSELRETFMDRGLGRLFPQFNTNDIVYSGVHRARHVQPLPLVDGARTPQPDGVPTLQTPFQIVNTSMLQCATLNNNEVVGLVNGFLDRNALERPRERASSYDDEPNGSGVEPAGAGAQNSR